MILANISGKEINIIEKREKRNEFCSYQSNPPRLVKISNSKSTSSHKDGFLLLDSRLSLGSPQKFFSVKSRQAFS
jgi:hypothetical protein